MYLAATLRLTLALKSKVNHKDGEPLATKNNAALVLKREKIKASEMASSRGSELAAVANYETGRVNEAIDPDKDADAFGSIAPILDLILTLAQTITGFEKHREREPRLAIFPCSKVLT